MVVLLASAENPSDSVEFARVYGDEKLRELGEEGLASVATEAVQKMYSGKPVLGIEDGRVVASFETLEDGERHRAAVGSGFFFLVYATARNDSDSRVVAGR